MFGPKWADSRRPWRDLKSNLRSPKIVNTDSCKADFSALRRVARCVKRRPLPPPTPSATEATIRPRGFRIKALKAPRKYPRQSTHTQTGPRGRVFFGLLFQIFLG